MILYHFTGAPNLRPISRYGLTIGDVPTDLRRSQGRVGVWLTTSSESTGHGLARVGIGGPPPRYRLMLDLPPTSSLVRWSDWAFDNVTPETRENLIRCAGKDGPSQWQTWFVHFGPIPPTTILGCQDMDTGEAIQDWANVWPSELDARGVPPYRRHAWHDQLLKRDRRGLRGLEARGLQIAF